MRSEREKGGDHVQGIPKGAALGAPLVTFPATGKSPGCRAERLQVDAGATSPVKSPGVRGGAQRGHSPLARKPWASAERKTESAEGQRPSHIAGRRSLRSCKWPRRGPLQRSGKLGIIRRLFTIF